MKAVFIIFTISLLSFISSCSNGLDNIDTSKENSIDVNKVNSLVNDFEQKFSDEVDMMCNVKTRSVEINNTDYDLLLDSIGNVIIADLLPSSTNLVYELGLQDSDFEELETEYNIPSDFLKVYFAMGIMEANLKSFNTRAAPEDIATCVIFGYGYKNLVEGGAKLALRKSVQQFAKKLIPCLGWGWWAAETAACLARL